VTVRAEPPIPWLPHLVRALDRRRRLVVAVLVAAAVAVGLPVLAPSPPEFVAVTVAARDLAGGVRLAAADLALTHVPPASVPDGAFGNLSSLVGRVLAGRVRRGEPFTDAQLVGPGLLAPGSDLVEAPVRIADAGAATLLRSGDLVDVVAVLGSSSGTTVPDGGDMTGVPRSYTVASAARVLAVPAEDAAADAGALVVLGVPPATARALAAAAGQLSVVIRSEPTAG
jgi:pilus assembly protein CpaB